MKSLNRLILITAVAPCFGGPAAADEAVVSQRPTMVLKQIIEGMPKADKQEVRVLLGIIEPGQKTVFHSHQAPVTFYVLEGTFTLEIEGRPTVTVKKGEAFIEPTNTNLTGYNKSATERMTAVLFQVSDPDKPWLDLK